VELYQFFCGALAWIATVAVLWPVNIPLIALAYKIQKGGRPLGEEEEEEFWSRCMWAAGLLAVLTIAFVFLDYFIINVTDFPPGPIHLVVLMGYIPAAAFVTLYAFGYADLLDGLGTFVIYIGLPVFALMIVNAFTGLWNGPLSVAYGFLKMPT
jgi:hypothetical protein